MRAGPAAWTVNETEELVDTKRGKHKRTVGKMYVRQRGRRSGARIRSGATKNRQEPLSS